MSAISDSNGPTGLKSGDACWMRKNARELEALPEPGQVFTYGEFDGSIRERWNSLRSHNAILHADQLRDEDGNRLWTVHPKAYEIVEEYHETADSKSTMLPCDCPADSIRNLRGDGIQCKLCEQVFDREEVTDDV